MTINLTAVLITAIICFTICFVGKSSKVEKKDEKAEQAAGDNVIQIPPYIAQKKQGKGDNE